MVVFLLQVLIMVLLLVIGLKVGGAVGCGVFALLGELVMVFLFHLAPGKVPLAAVYIILAIGIAGGVLELAGGIDYLVSLAARVIRKYPKLITYVAPLVTFLFVFGVGTSNIALSLEPIIADTAVKAGIRPERPLKATALTANTALLCSPAAAAVAYMLSLFANHAITMRKYLLIVLPTALLTTLLLSTFMTLKKFKTSDKEFMQQYQAKDAEQGEQHFSVTTKLATLVFILGIALVLLFGIFPEIAPRMLLHGKMTAVPNDLMVMLLLFATAGINMAFCKINPGKVFATKIGSSAFGGLLAVLGPGWLGSTLFDNPHNLVLLKQLVGSIVMHNTWIVVPLIMLASMLIMSQSATVAVIFPIALSLGITPLFLLATVQALNFVFVIPAQPPMLFAADIDETGGTTKYGFIVPGIFTLLVSMVIGLIMIHVMPV